MTRPRDPSSEPLIALREEPLEAAEVLAAVQDPAAGGINLFSGTVRDHDRAAGDAADLDVVALEYAAHPTALQRLTEVVAEVAEEFDVVRVAAVHRVGRLEVGEVAVLVAVSAAHRDQAYEASRALIDRLKARVPIWKHQLFTDGSDEWVGLP